MSRKLTTEEFIQKALEKHGDKYDYSLVEYVNNNTKVKIICPIHGTFEQLPRSHLNGSICPFCANASRNLKEKNTTEQFIEEARKKHGDKYDYSNVKYMNSYTKVKIICPAHGLFEQIPRNHLSGACCPKCKSSKGEGQIRFFLKENNIVFEEQKKFHNCKDINLLSYDFYIPEKNLLIEYNGR